MVLHFPIAKAVPPGRLTKGEKALISGCPRNKVHNEK